jgi:hypothetical protein
MNQRDIYDFIRSLKNYPLTLQQKKSLRGQSLAGDLVGAIKGLNRISMQNHFLKKEF